MATIPSELIRIKEVLDATNISVTDEIEIYEYAAKLRDRIDKAIEYIEQFENIKAYYIWIEDGYEEYNYDEDFKKDILNILRGEDEETK